MATYPPITRNHFALVQGNGQLRQARIHVTRVSPDAAPSDDVSTLTITRRDFVYALDGLTRLTDSLIFALQHKRELYARAIVAAGNGYDELYSPGPFPISLPTNHCRLILMPEPNLEVLLPAYRSPLIGRYRTHHLLTLVNEEQISIRVAKAWFEEAVDHARTWDPNQRFWYFKPKPGRVDAFVGVEDGERVVGGEDLQQKQRETSLRAQSEADSEPAARIRVGSLMAGAVLAEQGVGTETEFAEYTPSRCAAHRHSPYIVPTRSPARRHCSINTVVHDYQALQPEAFTIPYSLAAPSTYTLTHHAQPDTLRERDSNPFANRTAYDDSPSPPTNTSNNVVKIGQTTFNLDELLFDRDGVRVVAGGFDAKEVGEDMDWYWKSAGDSVDGDKEMDTTSESSVARGEGISSPTPVLEYSQPPRDISNEISRWYDNDFVDRWECLDTEGRNLAKQREYFLWFGRDFENDSDNRWATTAERDYWHWWRNRLNRVNRDDKLGVSCDYGAFCTVQEWLTHADLDLGWIGPTHVVGYVPHQRELKWRAVEDIINAVVRGATRGILASTFDADTSQLIPFLSTRDLGCGATRLLRMLVTHHVDPRRQRAHRTEGPPSQSRAPSL